MAFRFPEVPIDVTNYDGKLGRMKRHPPVPLGKPHKASQSNKATIAWSPQENHGVQSGLPYIWFPWIA